MLAFSSLMAPARIFHEIYQRLTQTNDDVIKVISRSQREKPNILSRSWKSSWGSTRHIQWTFFRQDPFSSKNNVNNVLLLYPQEELRDYEDLISKGVYSAQKARLNTILTMFHTFHKPNYHDLANLIALSKVLFYADLPHQKKNRTFINFPIFNIWMITRCSSEQMARY